ncbi:MAG: hypothetical protein ACXABY_01345 [Candidatus Thorarchaeota archaeon]|jgi:hypothetical protein
MRRKRAMKSPVPDCGNRDTSWQICPDCYTGIDSSTTAELKRAEEEKDASYGKVSQEEYLRLVNVVRDIEMEIEEASNDPEMNLYVNTALWLDMEGHLHVHYHGKCSVCGLEIKKVIDAKLVEDAE